MHPIENFQKMVTAGNVLGPEGTWITRNEALKRKKSILKHVISGEIEKNGTWISMANLFRQDTPQSATLPTSQAEEVIHLNPSILLNDPVSDLTLTPFSDDSLTRQAPPPFLRQSTLRQPPESVKTTDHPAGITTPPDREEPVLFSPQKQHTIPPVREKQHPVPHVEPDKPFIPASDLTTETEQTTPPASRPEEPVISTSKKQDETPPVREKPKSVATPKTAETTVPPIDLSDRIDDRAITVSQKGEQDQSSRQMPKTGFPVQKDSGSAHEPQPAEYPKRETITIRTIPLGKDTTLTVSETRAASALVAVCSIQGFIDQSNADDFNAQLASMLEFGVRYFILDLEQTILVGSAGWGIFAVTARFIKSSHGHFMICGMKEDIEESFHLLQFNEVIDSRKTISECLDAIQQIIIKSTPEQESSDESPSIFMKYGESYDDLPLPEKIKTIIAQNGPLSLFRIVTFLKTEQFGSISINPVKLYMLLREMNLDTKLKQTRYYRSC
ncbi:MAG: STAS domain-containing protein [Chitinispirillaceae bacterium]|nr:STAS domain-containing protein [Chitinispirillaceae bacterium]